MKKKVLTAFAFLMFLLIAPLIFAAENQTDNADLSQIDKAYACLENKVKDRCSSLSLEEQTFSLLALNHKSDISSECKDAIITDSSNSECWPKNGCKIISTAQAVLALENAGENVDKPKDWLLSQKSIPKNIDWYLEIESADATTCRVSYGSEYTVGIGENKKISSGAGSCLSVSENGYWLKISSNCYDKEFSVSCDKSFLTTLLYKKKTSSTIHVSEKVTEASAEGTTRETVNSACFKQGTTCGYLGSLWATLVLDSLGEDISSFVPYLISMADESGNEKYLPEVFLYLITSRQDFYVDLLGKQKVNFWDESGDKFYDTALALYGLQNEEPAEKTNSLDWLLEDGVQDRDGCWKGHTRNTAFILYSAFPKKAREIPNVAEDDCEDVGGYCMSSITCEETGGGKLSSFCPGVSICCDKQKIEKTCVEKGGTICNSNEVCSGVGDVAADLDYGQECCLQGICQEPIITINECKDDYNGVCRVSGCSNDEDEMPYDCEFAGDSCCVKKTTPDKKGIRWWIWLLLILIILLIIAIIFRDKLRPYWFKIKSKFKKKPKGGAGVMQRRPPGFPPTMPTMMRPMPGRRILPPGARPMGRGPIARKPKGDSEVSDVLKKLKEIGK